MKQPKILIFDEATSALDSSNEEKVQETIDKLREDQEGLTMLVIAHRLSTIRNSDIIFVLKEGQIVETGTYDELMNAKGDYYKMEMQQDADLEFDDFEDSINVSEGPMEKRVYKIAKDEKAQEDDVMEMDHIALNDMVNFKERKVSFNPSI